MQNLYRVYWALEYKLHPALVFIDAHILDKRTRLNNSGGSGGIQKGSRLLLTPLSVDQNIDIFIKVQNFILKNKRFTS